MTWSPRVTGERGVRAALLVLWWLLPPHHLPLYPPSSRCPMMTEAPAIGHTRTLGIDVSCRFSPRPERARRQLQGSGSQCITTPSTKEHPRHPPKLLHNTPSMPGHVGQCPPQCGHCCAQGWLSHAYHRDETPSSHAYTHIVLVMSVVVC